MAKKSPLKLGKETYGTIPIEEAFRLAFAPYFTEVSEKKEKDKKIS